MTYDHGKSYPSVLRAVYEHHVLECNVMFVKAVFRLQSVIVRLIINEPN